MRITLALLIFSNYIFANQCPTGFLTKKILDSGHLNKTNPREDFEKLKSKFKVSYDCILKSAQKAIDIESQKWIKKAETSGCYNNPTSHLCDMKVLREIVANLSAFDIWKKSINSNTSEFSIFCNKNYNEFVKEKELDSLLNDLWAINLYTKKKERLQKRLKSILPPCEEGVITNSKTSPNYKYYESLLARYQENPEKVSLNELLVPWFPNDNIPKDIEKEPYYYSCEDSPYGYFNAFKEDRTFNNYFLKERCTPDTLYSWGPKVKLQNILKNNPSNEQWKGPINPYKGAWNNNLYTTVSPFSTFGYGQYSIRIKVKPNIPFKKATHREFDSIIGVRSDGHFNDFTISNSSLIESYSYGTPEHYDEIIFGLRNLIEGKRTHLYRANMDEISKMKRTPMETFFANIGKKLGFDTDIPNLDKLNYYTLDGFLHDEKILKERLIAHIELILQNKGKIIYAKDFCSNSSIHFSTDKPTDFNPN